jgi:hypothetical protein
LLLLPLLLLFVRKTRVAMLHPTASTPQHTSLHSTEQPCCAHRTSATSLTATVFSIETKSDVPDETASL